MVWLSVPSYNTTPQICRDHVTGQHWHQSVESLLKINLNIKAFFSSGRNTLNATCDAVLNWLLLSWPSRSPPHTALGSSHLDVNIRDVVWVFFIWGGQLLPWVWGARLWIHGYIFHRQRPRNNEGEGGKKAEQHLRTHNRVITFCHWKHRSSITIVWLYKNKNKRNTKTLLSCPDLHWTAGSGGDDKHVTSVSQRQYLLPSRQTFSSKLLKSEMQSPPPSGGRTASVVPATTSPQKHNLL